MNNQHLTNTITALLSNGKGILAADETPGNIGKKLSVLHIENTAENRRRYREMLFTTPGIDNYISGVILQDETIHQATNAGIQFTQLLHDKNIHVGIKVDLGLTPFSSESPESRTQGLDELDVRLQKYASLGATFAKWRAVIHINAESNLPTQQAIQKNVDDLAKYAFACQRNNIVPIVEPEILMEGTHTIDTTFQISKKVLTALFDALALHSVDLTRILLKPSMVIPGIMCTDQASEPLIAQKTLECFTQALPDALPGVVFLSGGQSDSAAVNHLAIMNQSINLPWILSFSYGRALQRKAMLAWAGKDENTLPAQTALLTQAKLCSLATLGNHP